MIKTISPEFYYGFISALLVIDIFIYMKIRNIDKKNQVKFARIGLITSFLYLGIAATVGTTLAPLIVWPPSILALMIFGYLSFIKYPPTNS